MITGGCVVRWNILPLVTHPARANKIVLLDLLTLHRQGPFLEFLEAIEKAGAVRTLESLARIGRLGVGGRRLLPTSGGGLR